MRFDVQLYALLAFALLSGCRSHREPARSPDAQETFDATDVGTVLEPASDEERQVLSELPKLAAGDARTFGAVKVVPEAPYTAASGRECRRLSVAPTAKGAKASFRLACSDGERWFFVPDVFGAGEGAAGPK